MVPVTKPTRGLGGALLGYFVLVTAVITLAPFRLRWPSRIVLTGFTDARDAVANVLLFVPLGFLLALRYRLGVWRALLVGALYSAALETAQLFVAGRCTSLVDVATNSAGAAVGAFLHARVGARLDARLGARLLLELPLMGLVYLLVPVIWLAGLGSSETPARLLAVLPLGLFGAAALGTVVRHRLEPGSHPDTSPLVVAILAGVAATGWLTIAAVPALVAAPWLSPLAPAAGLLAALIASRPLSPATERRFEQKTLLRWSPLLGLYFVATALWPWLPSAATSTHPGWQGGLALPPLARFGGLVQVLEYVAAFTVLGYVLAEARSRREDPPVRAASEAAGAALATAVSLEVLRGAHPAQAASAGRALLGGVAALAGAVIFRSQLEAVRAVLGRRR